MRKKPYRVGEKSSTGHTIATILGESPLAFVFTTTNNELRWVYYGNNGLLPEKLGAAVARFDLMMKQIKALKTSADDKREIYLLLGKSLFVAMNCRKQKTLASAFDSVAEIIESHVGASHVTGSSGLKSPDGASVFDVVILCALHNPELLAVLRLGKWSKMQPIPSDPQTYHSSKWKSVDGQEIRLIAAAPNHMGLVASAALAAKMIWRFRPLLVCMTGIAAGTKSHSQGYGDVLAPSQTFDYGGGKTIVSKGAVHILPNPNPLSIGAKLEGRLNEWRRERTGLDAILRGWPAQTPATALNLHLGPLFSSPTVLDASQPIKEVTSHWRKLIGVEMEAHAVHRACHDTIEPAPLFLCFKSICDFAEGKTDDWQHFAAYTSARLLHSFLVAEWPTLCSPLQ